MTALDLHCTCTWLHLHLAVLLLTALNLYLHLMAPALTFDCTGLVLDCTCIWWHLHLHLTALALQLALLYPTVIIHCLLLISGAMLWGWPSEEEGRHTCFHFAKTNFYILTWGAGWLDDILDHAVPNYMANVQGGNAKWSDWIWVHVTWFSRSAQSKDVTCCKCSCGQIYGKIQ